MALHELLGPRVLPQALSLKGGGHYSGGRGAYLLGHAFSVAELQPFATELARLEFLFGLYQQLSAPVLGASAKQGRGKQA